MRERLPWRLLLHLVLAGVATNVKEVRRRAAVELDDVHRRHRQARAIDHAPNLPVQPDVVQVVLRRRHFPATDSGESACGQVSRPLSPQRAVARPSAPTTAALNCVIQPHDASTQDTCQSAYLGSSCDESRMAKIAFCRNAALSSKPSFASAAISSPSSVSARGFTCTEPQHHEQPRALHCIACGGRL